MGVCIAPLRRCKLVLAGGAACGEREQVVNDVVVARLPPGPQTTEITLAAGSMAGAYRACSEHVPASYRTCDAHMHTAYIIVTWRLQTGRITGTVTATCETIRLFSRRYDTMHAPTISPRALNRTSMSLPNRLELSLRTCVRPVRAGVCVRCACACACGPSWRCRTPRESPTS